MGVYGNHCAGSYMKLLKIANVHDAVADWGGLRFIGMEGCPRYRKGPIQHTQEQASEKMQRWPKADVVLSHAPPLGVHDDPDRASHTGWEGLASYARRHSPSFVLHGHTHPESDTDLLGSTQVLWVWRYRLLEL
jgi:Icc-related predicted phosphoesterase